MKKFIIVTVDTEGDNLWDWTTGKEIETKNSKFLVPFQDICEKYRFYPVYLTNYEMAMDDYFADFARKKATQGLCEIGMHLHAWNTPPEYTLSGEYSGNPYITEYPRDVIKEKHVYLKKLIYDRIGAEPVSYRSGRWATSIDLFSVLDELGFKVDCSVTPGIIHAAPGVTVSCANDYRKAMRLPYNVQGNLFEVPMTTRVRRTLRGNNLKRKVINTLRGQRIWLRPALHTKDEMCALIDIVKNEETDYLMFMIHSSELMPGGSPYCKTSEDVEQFLKKLDDMFAYVKDFGEGILLKDYADSLCR